jgi:uncharacterized phage protein (TIGR01671 family)
VNERYLFHGKRVDNGEWAEGYPQGDCGDGRPDTITNQNGAYLIDPATIGQCTGLRDKNGKLVFEGDRVRVEGCRAPIYEEARSQYDGKVVAVAIVEFSCFGWTLNGDTDENRRLCELRGNETTDRTIRFHKDLYYYNPSVEMRRLNPRHTKWDITVVNTIHDNPELLEAK